MNKIISKFLFIMVLVISLLALCSVSYAEEQSPDIAALEKESSEVKKKADKIWAEMQKAYEMQRYMESSVSADKNEILNISQYILFTHLSGEYCIFTYKENNGLYNISLPTENLNKVMAGSKETSAELDRIYSSFNFSTESETRKITVITKYIIDNTEPVSVKDNDNSLYGLLFRHKGQCSAYTNAFYALCKRAGIRCQIVGSRNDDHVWVRYFADGKWLESDIFWSEFMSGMLYMENLSDINHPVIEYIYE